MAALRTARWRRCCPHPKGGEMEEEAMEGGGGAGGRSWPWGGSWWGSPGCPQGVRSQRPPGEDGAQGEEGSGGMLSQGGLRWAGGLDGYPGWCFGGSGSWGNVPHPQNFPPTRVKAVSGERSFVGNFPGREAGNASCWEERMAPGGGWIGMEGTRGTRWTPPPVLTGPYSAGWDGEGRGCRLGALRGGRQHSLSPFTICCFPRGG